MATNLMRAHNEWSTRPDDQRFLTLAALEDHCMRRAARSDEQVVPLGSMVAMRRSDVDGPAGDVRGDLAKELILLDQDGNTRSMTHWAFGQVCNAASAPAAYLRRLPAELAAKNLQYGMAVAGADEVKLLGDRDLLMAATSPTYGRIWDWKVANAVARAADPTIWTVPSNSVTRSKPAHLVTDLEKLRATTLYASDRDCFIFLVDEQNPIEIGQEVLHRGFMVWNSEVGSATFGISTFLYRYVCDNRIIWGAEDVKTLTIRHTKGGPERFMVEAECVLNQIRETSPKPVIEMVKAASVSKFKDENEASAFLVAKGEYTVSQARTIIMSAMAEEGRASSVWELVQGATAIARSQKNTNTRIDWERRASKLLRYVAAA